MKKSRFNLRDDSGALAIEAVISMFFFTIAVLAIMFMSVMVRAQSMVQYAISQAAKEISGYYYIVDKLGLSSLTSGKSAHTTDEANEIIKNAVDFSSSAGNAVSFDLNSGTPGIDITKLDTVDTDSLKKAAESIKKMDVKDQLTGTLCVLAKSLINEGVSQIVAPFICDAVVPKYMGGSREAADTRLRALGIDGMDSIDFTYSSFLRDGRTIQVVAIYKMDVSKLTFGMVSGELTFKQVATTAAWVTPNDKGVVTVAKTLNFE